MEITKQMADEVRAFLNENAIAIHLHNEHMSSPAELNEILPYESLKITYMQSNIISHLAHTKDGCLTMGALAQKEGLDKCAATRSVAALVKMGIVRRFQKPDNLRNVYIELTDFGKKMREDEMKILEEYFIEKFYAVFTYEEIIDLKNTMINFSTALKRFNKSDTESGGQV